MMRHDGRVVAITGAGSGIGLATALRFLDDGASVVGADYNPSGLVALETAATERGVADRLRTVRADVREEDDIAATVALAIEAHGVLDCFYANAGVGGAVGPIVETSAEDWDYTQAVLLRGVFLSFKHAAKAMIADGRGGVLLTTASVSGLLGGCGPVGYSTAKAGVAHLVRMAAAELAVHRIRVAAVAPGGVNTPMMHRGHPEMGRQLLKQTQPWPDAGEPEDVADAVLFLASDAARFVTGEILVVDGGLIAQGSGLTTRFADAAPMAGLVGRDVGETGQDMVLRPIGSD